MVPLAMLGLVTPLLAAVTMPLSSLAVIGNAARLGRLFPATDGAPAPTHPLPPAAVAARVEVAPWR
jgi:Cu2+-exporting ATPase